MTSLSGRLPSWSRARCSYPDVMSNGAGTVDVRCPAARAGTPCTTVVLLLDSYPSAYTIAMYGHYSDRPSHSDVEGPARLREWSIPFRVLDDCKPGVGDFGCIASNRLDGVPFAFRYLPGHRPRRSAPGMDHSPLSTKVPVCCGQPSRMWFESIDLGKSDHPPFHHRICILLDRWEDSRINLP